MKRERRKAYSFGDQTVQRDRRKLGVAEVGFAVGQRQLEGFYHRMDIGRRIMSHGLQVEVLEHIERQLEYRGLRPGALATDFVSQEACSRGSLEASLVCVQVF